MKSDFQPMDDHSEGKYTLMAIISHIGKIHGWIHESKDAWIDDAWVDISIDTCIFIISIIIVITIIIVISIIIIIIIISINSSSLLTITMLGKSTDHGHYVCHIKKDNDWILYNDEKVGGAS